MKIGEAIDALERGERVARAGWNGKGMYLELQVPDAHSKMSLPYVFMFTACKNRVPWLASQTDLLAKDWEIVGEGTVQEPARKPLPGEITRWLGGESGTVLLCDQAQQSAALGKETV